MKGPARRKCLCCQEFYLPDHRLVYQEADKNTLPRQQGNSTKELRKQIFSLYVERMYQLKGATTVVLFPKEKLLGWLSSLAREMRKHSQSVFNLEDLQPSSLGTNSKRLAYGTIVGLSLGIVAGLINWLLLCGIIMSIYVQGYRLSPLPIAELIKLLPQGLIAWLATLISVVLGCWSKSPLKNGVISGSIGCLLFLVSVLVGGRAHGPGVGLFVGVGGVLIALMGAVGVGSLNSIVTVETIGWKWSNFLGRAIPGSLLGLNIGLFCWLVFVTIAASILGRFDSLIFILTADVNLHHCLIVALISGCIFGVISGLIGLFDETSPSQGIQRPLKVSVTGFIVTLLIFFLLTTFGYRWGNALVDGVIAGLIVGLIVGFILIALCALVLNAFAGWSWVTINGQTYSVWTSQDGRCQAIGNID
jgi:hypothetical protein